MGDKSAQRMGASAPEPKPHWVITLADGSRTVLRDAAASYQNGQFGVSNQGQGTAITEKQALQIEKEEKEKKEKKGGRRTRKWIQGVVKKMKKGTFTREALRHHMTPERYADAVLAHPKKHTLRTRRRALFLRTVRGTRRR